MHHHRLLLYLVLLVANGLLCDGVTACKLFDWRLVLRVAHWLVLNNLAGGVASVVLAAAHISCNCADFPFEAGFHAPPYEEWHALPPGDRTLANAWYGGA